MSESVPEPWSSVNMAALRDRYKAGENIDYIQIFEPFVDDNQLYADYLERSAESEKDPIPLYDYLRTHRPMVRETRAIRYFMGAFREQVAGSQNVDQFCQNLDWFVAAVHDTFTKEDGEPTYRSPFGTPGIIGYSYDNKPRTDSRPKLANELFKLGINYLATDKTADPLLLADHIAALLRSSPLAHDRKSNFNAKGIAVLAKEYKDTRDAAGMPTQEALFTQRILLTTQPNHAVNNSMDLFDMIASDLPRANPEQFQASLDYITDSLLGEIVGKIPLLSDEEKQRIVDYCQESVCRQAIEFGASFATHATSAEQATAAADALAAKLGEKDFGHYQKVYGQPWVLRTRVKRWIQKASGLPVISEANLLERSLNTDRGTARANFERPIDDFTQHLLEKLTPGYEPRQEVASIMSFSALPVLRDNADAFELLEEGLSELMPLGRERLIDAGLDLFLRLAESIGNANYPISQRGQQIHDILTKVKAKGALSPAHIISLANSFAPAVNVKGQTIDSLDTRKLTNLNQAIDCLSAYMQIYDGPWFESDRQLFATAIGCVRLLITTGTDRKLQQPVLTELDLILRYPDATEQEMQVIFAEQQTSNDQNAGHRVYRELKARRRSARFRLHTPGSGLYS